MNKSNLTAQGHKTHELRNCKVCKDPFVIDKSIIREKCNNCLTKSK